MATLIEIQFYTLLTMVTSISDYALLLPRWYVCHCIWNLLFTMLYKKKGKECARLFKSISVGNLASHMNIRFDTFVNYILYLIPYLTFVTNINIYHVMFLSRKFKTLPKYIFIFQRFMNNLLISIIHSIVSSYLWEVFNSVHYRKSSNKYWISFSNLFHLKSRKFIKYCISFSLLGRNNISKKATVKILKTTFLGYP